jgi:hypothetical protein
VVVNVVFSNLPIHLHEIITNEFRLKQRLELGKNNNSKDQSNIENRNGNKPIGEVILEENDVYSAKQLL